MKRYLLLLTFLLVVLFSFGQRPNLSSSTPKGIGKISGIILDEGTKNAVEFATISLYSQEDNKLISGTIADEKGKFAIIELVDGKYKLEISFLGYEKKTMADIEMVKEKNINLGKIMLTQEAKDLKEVTVTGQRALIEEKVDRMVYNAEQDDLAKGGDAASVLQKVPLLQVDLDGNVSLRGSSNIQVLINNKPSTILAESVADALKMLPADMIKKVEVITSPSAKYDAEGSGGIINIITKRNNLEGYYLNVNTGVGLRGSNLGLNGSLRKGKFGMTLGGFGRAFYAKSETEMNQKTLFDNITNITEQFATASNNGLFGRYNLGFDYDIDNTQFLSAGIRYGLRSFSNDQRQQTDLFSNGNLLTSALRDIDGTNSSNNIDVNLDYLKIFNDDQEWSISTLYSRNDGRNDFISDNLDDLENIENSLQNINDNLNQELTLQTDFQSPIQDNQMIEVGAKGIFRRVNSDFQYLFAADGVNFTTDFTQPSGVLDYEQNVSAAYTSYTYSTANKLTFKLGARYERTAISAVQDGENIEIPDYDNLVPSINISKSLKNFRTIKLGYNRRIQRPWLRQLNPNVNVSNSQDISVGNPNLQPELTDNIELGYSAMIKKTYLNISLFGRITDNAINQIRYPIDTIAGAILTTYENIGKERSTGTNIFMNVNISDKWTVNGGVNVFYSMLEGQITNANGVSETATNSGFNYGGRLMSQLKLGNGWTMQAFTFMRGRSVQLQGSRGGYGMYSVGFNKDFKNKKGSFGLAAENFAGRGWTMRTELESPNFTQTNTRLFINRSIRVNFNYKFGKMNFQSAQKKTKSVNNSDLMSGGDSSGGGMQGGGSSRSSGSSRSRSSRRSSKKSKKPATVAPAEGKAIDFSGKWRGVIESPRGEFEQFFEFKIDGEKLTGKITTAFGSTEIENGVVKENGKFSFDVTFRGFTMTQNGTVLEEKKILLQSDRGEMTIDKVE